MDPDSMPIKKPVKKCYVIPEGIDDAELQSLCVMIAVMEDELTEEQRQRTLWYLSSRFGAAKPR